MPSTRAALRRAAERVRLSWTMRGLATMANWTIVFTKPGQEREFRDIYGIALTNMLQGGDPASELKKASEQFSPILAKTENG